MICRQSSRYRTSIASVPFATFVDSKNFAASHDQYHNGQSISACPLPFLYFLKARLITYARLDLHLWRPERYMKSCMVQFSACYTKQNMPRLSERSVPSKGASGLQLLIDRHPVCCCQKLSHTRAPCIICVPPFFIATEQ